MDREERPDVDKIYMTAYQAMYQGGGGWPLNMFLTPELKPFAGGTYFPPESRQGRPSFIHVLQTLSKAWKEKEGAKRIPAATDDKILADWNGMMIASLAGAGRVLAEPRYLEASQKAHTFIKEKLWDGKRLYHRWRDGERDNSQQASRAKRPPIIV